MGAEPGGGYEIAVLWKTKAKSSFSVFIEENLHSYQSEDFVFKVIDFTEIFFFSFAIKNVGYMVYCQPVFALFPINDATVNNFACGFFSLLDLLSICVF